jgi:deoxyribose-phosphate aldolase
MTESFKKSEIRRRSKRIKLSQDNAIKLSQDNEVNYLRLMVRHLNGYIDYTNLNPDATNEDIHKLCNEAILNNYYSICINSSNNKYCFGVITCESFDIKPKICVVVGFPLGSSTVGTKIYEAQEALTHCADEIDMVWNLGRFKSGDYDYVYRELFTMKKIVLGESYSRVEPPWKITKKTKKILKVIVETAYLSDDEIRKAIEICADVGVDFIKTSTGFNNNGMNLKERQDSLLNAVKIMHEERTKHGYKILIKASGGIKDSAESSGREFATLLIQTGADRIGTSSPL